jgi:hypothetical protein
VGVFRLQAEVNLDTRTSGGLDLLVRVDEHGTRRAAAGGGRQREQGEKPGPAG